MIKIPSNTKYWIPDFLIPVRSLKNIEEPGPRKFVWHCIDLSGRDLLVKAVYMSRFYSILNEFLILSQVSQLCNHCFRVPRALYLLSKNNYLIMITDFIVQNNTIHDVSSGIILESIRSLQQIPNKLLSLKKSDSFSIEQFLESFSHEKSKRLALKYIIRNEFNRIALLRLSQRKQKIIHGDLSINHFIKGQAIRDVKDYWYIVDWEHAHYGNPVRDYSSILVHKAILLSRKDGHILCPWEGTTYPIFVNFLDQLNITERELLTDILVLCIYKIDYLLKYKRDKYTEGKAEIDYLLKVLEKTEQ